MKLLIATGLYPPDIGGPATYTTTLEKELPKHNISIEVLPFMKVRNYPKVIRHFLYTAKLIRKAWHADALYALDPVSVGLPTYFASVITRRPYFVRVAGDYAWEQGQQRFGVTDLLDTYILKPTRYHFFVSVLFWIQRFVAEHAAQIIVPSKYMQGIVEKWGIDGTKIHTVYSALHPLQVTEHKETIRLMYGYEGLVLSTAARLVPWKGVKTLISLIQQLRESGISATLVVLGSGPLEASLKEYATELNVAPAIRFMGSVPKDELGRHVVASDIFILNTAYEGLSHQLLEVMDLGVPIITTAVGGNLELITDNISGILVPFDDAAALAAAVIRLQNDEVLRKACVTNAKQKRNEFAEEKLTKQLVSILLHQIE